MAAVVVRSQPHSDTPEMTLLHASVKPRCPFYARKLILTISCCKWFIPCIAAKHSISGLSKLLDCQFGYPKWIRPSLVLFGAGNYWPGLWIVHSLCPERSRYIRVIVSRKVWGPGLVANPEKIARQRWSRTCGRGERRWKNIVVSWE